MAETDLHYMYVVGKDEGYVAAYQCKGMRLATPSLPSIQEALEEAQKVGLGGYKLLERGWDIPMTDGVVAEGVAEITRMLDAAIEEERAAARAWLAEFFDRSMPELAQAPMETGEAEEARCSPTRSDPQGFPIKV